ncbi:hypothetical protein HYU11_00725 [Candidatus Woesearchaeota archaeon]|nr:hypothetical protein [Candidatus Woesearchaeota archaeon]
MTTINKQITALLDEITEKTAKTSGIAETINGLFLGARAIMKANDYSHASSYIHNVAYVVALEILVDSLHLEGKPKEIINAVADAHIKRVGDRDYGMPDLANLLYKIVHRDR